jgi:hypothetical protein
MISTGKEEARQAAVEESIQRVFRLAGSAATPFFSLAIFAAVCLVKTSTAHKFAPDRHNHGDNLARPC